jgi:hypothetical protein
MEIIAGLLSRAVLEGDNTTDSLSTDHFDGTKMERWRNRSKGTLYFKKNCTKLTCVYARACVYACVWMCVCMGTCVYMYVCMYIYIYTHTYTHTCTHIHTYIHNTNVHTHTYIHSLHRTVLLEKLTGSAASQEIPRIFGTRRFLTVLTVPATWANSIHSPQLPTHTHTHELTLSSSSFCMAPGC